MSTSRVYQFGACARQEFDRLAVVACNLMKWRL
jgi:hypothetical protein